MTSIAGFPAASTASPPPRHRHCNTQVRLTTPRDSPICIPMAPFPPVGLWIRLEAVWRGPRLVPIHKWAMDHGSRFWLDLAQLSAVGWAPYHYGGWLFDSSCGGWFYSPQFSTDTQVSSRPGKAVPRAFIPRVHLSSGDGGLCSPGGKERHRAHASARSKRETPLNLERGVLSNVGTKGVTHRSCLSSTDKNGKR